MLSSEDSKQPPPPPPREKAMDSEDSMRRNYSNYTQRTLTPTDAFESRVFVRSLRRQLLSSEDSDCIPNVHKCW